MHPCRQIASLVAWAALLAACGTPPAATSPAQPGTTIASSSSSAPAETTAQHSATAAGAVPAAQTASAGTALPALSEAELTVTPAPASTIEPAFAGADTPNDTTQARLRVSNCIFNGPSVDVVVNGNVATNAGVPQTKLGALDVSGYLYLAPATYRVALVPTGKDIAAALLGPLDVTLAAGHRYTLVMLGQANEPSRTPLVIDETAAYQAAGAKPGDAAHITINNLKGARELSFIQDGMGEKAVPYGGFAASVLPVGKFNDFEILANGQAIDKPGPGFNDPVDWLDCFSGTYPRPWDTHSAPEMSPLNIIDFLQVRTDVSAKNGADMPAFTTFLAALKTAGLTDMLATGGPYIVFAPTDEAFAALPQDKRDALMADPKTLTDLLSTHIVEGFYPFGTLGPIGRFDRTLTTLGGAQLILSGGGGRMVINRDHVGSGNNTTVANGSRVFPLTKVLQPVAK